MKRTTTEELCRLLAAIAVGVTTVTAADKAGVVSSQSQGLHGYIGFSHDQPPAGSGYSAGMGFYAAVWPLIDQPLADFQIGLPSFQQYAWNEEKKAKLQAFVEKLHAAWPIDRDYMAPPSHGKLVTLDQALLVTPPAGFEVGYVPIVTRQARE